MNALNWEIPDKSTFYGVVPRQIDRRRQLKLRYAKIQNEVPNGKKE